MLDNPLDILFKDIKRQMHEERVQPRPPKPPRVSQYANPDNWTPGRVVTLIHITEGKLGDYQEYFFRGRADSRRLLPANPLLASQASELVFGDHWLHPKFSAPVEPDSEWEERQVVARFNQLISEYR